MAQISKTDYETMLGCVGRLYEVAHLRQFPSSALTEILRLVGADSTTFNYVAPTVPKVVTVATPKLPDQNQRTERFGQYLFQHTVLNNFLATGDPGAFKLSDFQSEREYHALPLYQEFYREIQYEDQLSFFLFPPGGELIGISLARDRRRFTERDRQVLNLLRTHVANAYRHVERVTRLNGALTPTAGATRVTSVVLDARNRPAQFASEAQVWIKRFFPNGKKSSSHFPNEVTEWLREGAAVKRSPEARLRRVPTMVQESNGERLRLSVVPRGNGAERMLVLSIETLAEKAHTTPESPLTRREIDVLLEVEQGKSNAEVAATLGISPLTVRRHLEHIFEKLHASSRTAAVTSFRRLCHGSGDPTAEIR